MKHWWVKFQNAFRGLAVGCRETSFRFHLVAAFAVTLLAWWLKCEPVEWCVLLLCIGTVWSAELMNTAIEHLSRAVTRDTKEEIRASLDVAAAGVLVACGTAVVIGCFVLLRRLIWPEL